MHKPRPMLFLGLPYQKGDSVSLWEIPLQVFLTTLPSLSSRCRLAMGDPLCPGIPVLLLPRGHCLGSDILHELMLLGPGQPCCWPPRQMVLLPDLTPQDNRQRTICSSFVEVTSLQNWKPGSLSSQEIDNRRVFKLWGLRDLPTSSFPVE